MSIDENAAPRGKPVTISDLQGLIQKKLLVGGRGESVRAMEDDVQCMHSVHG